MEENKQATKKKHTSEQLIPYQWFWTNTYGERMGFVEWIKSRPFSILYLAVIWTIIGILGFASTRNCDTWQQMIACDRAIYMIKMVTHPLEYVMSWFTAPYFHNGLDHILFVTIFGFMMPVQSFEVQYGTRSTIIIFIISYVVVGVFFGSLFNVGIAYWPKVEFFQFGFERSWMGGSVGFYAVIGALAHTSRKQWFLLLLIGCFEILNLAVIGIDVHISFIHVISATSGFLTCKVLKSKGMLAAN